MFCNYYKDRNKYKNIFCRNYEFNLYLVIYMSVTNCPLQTVIKIKKVIKIYSQLFKLKRLNHNTNLLGVDIFIGK